MHRVDFALGRGGCLVDREFSDVKFVGLFDVEVVGQVHIAVVEQAVGNAQVLALVAVEHGNLAEV